MWTASLENVAEGDQHAVITYAGQFSANCSADATFVLFITGENN